MNRQELEQILIEADRAPLGVVVQTNDPQSCRARLYTVRLALARKGVDFTHLKFKTSPTAPDTELWIVSRRSTDAEEGRGVHKGNGSSL